MLCATPSDLEEISYNRERPGCASQAWSVIEGNDGHRFARSDWIVLCSD
jgi:hypothetical protein